MYGDIGDDTLRGKGGNDQIHGEDSNDKIFGGLGNDLLYGDDGQDFLQGDEGDDLCSGGGGNSDKAGQVLREEEEHSLIPRREPARSTSLRRRCPRRQRPTPASRRSASS